VIRVAAALAAMAVMVTGAALAASGPPDEVVAGRRLATRQCGECHGIDPGQASRMAEAPRFPELYTTFPVERLAEALERDVFTGLPHMKAFALDEDERVQLQAYLVSFKPQPRTALPPVL